MLSRISIAALTLLASSAPPAADLPQLGRNPTSEVVASMTTEEKVNLVIGTGMNISGLPLFPPPASVLQSN